MLIDECKIPIISSVRQVKNEEDSLFLRFGGTGSFGHVANAEVVGSINVQAGGQLSVEVERILILLVADEFLQDL